MSKNIYFFGDSFTDINPNANLRYRYWLKTPFTHWRHQICDHLKISRKNEINLSRSGMSTQEIFDKCLSTSNKMKKGDWVIISDSPTIRQIGYDKRYKEIRTYNNEALFSPLASELSDARYSLTKGIEFTEQVENYEKLGEIYINYLYYFVKPHINYWETYYRENIINLLNLLQDKGVNCIYWSWRVWDKEWFTCWRDEWSGKGADDHWGQQGCNEFAEYLKKRIDKKEITNENEWEPKKTNFI